MASPWKLMGKYWNNPTAVLDALEISEWPSEDDSDESFHRGHHQHRPAQVAVRWDAPTSVAKDGTRPNGAVYARSFSVGHRHQQQQPPRPTAGRPRAKPWLIKSPIDRIRFVGADADRLSHFPGYIRNEVHFWAVRLVKGLRRYRSHFGHSWPIVALRIRPGADYYHTAPPRRRFELLYEGDTWRFFLPSDVPVDVKESAAVASARARMPPPRHQPRVADLRRGGRRNARR